MMRKAFSAVVITALALAAPAFAQNVMLEDFESPPQAGYKVSESVPGSVVYSIAGDPAGGKYMQLTFDRGEKAGMAYIYLPVIEKLAASAGKYDGLAMRVKGDGSSTFGLIEVRTDGYKNIFQAIIPLASTEWTDVTIRWDEFFQTNDVAEDSPLNWADVNVFAFGSRAGWGSCSFAVDSISLAKIPERPSMAAPAGYARLAATVAKLKAGKPVKIVALGDSITYGTKVPSANREKALYFQVAAGSLAKTFPGVEITTVNAGVGGDSIPEGLIRIGHQVAAQEPDLVMVLLGANDAIYEFPESRVRRTMSYLVDTLLKTTDAEILLLGPTPITDKPGIPESYDEVYAQIAKAKGIAYLNLTPSLTILAPEDYKNAYGDTVHLSEYGHGVTGIAVFDYIVELSR